MSFKFEFVLGADIVKRVVFPAERGRRELRSSGGDVIGQVVLTPNGVRLELREFAAKIIADAQFH